MFGFLRARKEGPGRKSKMGVVSYQTPYTVTRFFSTALKEYEMICFDGMKIIEDGSCELSDIL